MRINGSDYRALIDLGSSSAFSIPSKSDLANQILSNLAKQMLSKYNFRENEREIYTIGGLVNTKESIGTIRNLTLDGIPFENVNTTIRHTSQLRIGRGVALTSALPQRFYIV